MGEVAINLVPLEVVKVLPRPGDVVFLPGETREGVNLGGAEYEVEKSVLQFIAKSLTTLDQPCPAVPAKIVAYVRRAVRVRPK